MPTLFWMLVMYSCLAGADGGSEPARHLISCCPGWADGVLHRVIILAVPHVWSVSCHDNSLGRLPLLGQLRDCGLDHLCGHGLRQAVVRTVVGRPSLAISSYGTVGFLLG